MAGYLGIGLLFLLYITPMVIAARAKHPQTEAIAALNIFLGWSVLGWIAAFVWACTKPGRVEVVRGRNGLSRSQAIHDVDALERLAKLRDTGVLTPQEFEAKKRAVLDLSGT